jgi:hypothetical protein
LNPDQIVLTGILGVSALFSLVGVVTIIQGVRKGIPEK